MEVLKLSEVEQQFYGKLFSCCDPENAGFVSWNRASELFIASQLSLEMLSKITDLCGVKRVGQFGRSQFYIALRLISAAQNGHSVELDSFSSGVDLPLPKFVKREDKDVRWHEQQQNLFSQLVLGNSNDASINNSNAYIQQTATQQQHLPPGAILPPPPTNRVHSRSISSTGAQQQPRLNSVFTGDVDMTTVLQPQHVPQPTVNPNSQINVSLNGNTGIPGSETPPHGLNQRTADVNIVHDKTWTAFSKPDTQPSWMNFEEHHQLLSNEDDSSVVHSSDDDEDNDPYVLTNVLRNYYADQFKNLQPDIDGVIAGFAVKQFFEKSGLPTQELSRIWQLADIDKDGALSLEEFFIAMHLVVLRKKIPELNLPEKLPDSLLPSSYRKNNEAVSSPKSNSSADTSSLLKEKQWTKFTDSPVSSTSSPSMKPHNFDFPSNAIEQDPKILHPVAVRLSPDQMVSSSDECQTESIKSRTVSEPIPYKPLADPSSPTHLKSPKRLVDSNDVKFPPPPSSSQAIQRPMPRKPSTVPGPGAIPPPPPPSSSQITSPGEIAEENKNPTSSYSGPSCSASSAMFPTGPKKEPPPPPPPRPKKNHARSSSLDLNKLGKSALGIPPAVPPRTSPGFTTPKKLVGQHSESEVMSSSVDAADFADFTQFPDMPQQQQASSEMSAEEVKPTIEDEDVADRRRHLSAPLLSARAKETRDKKDLSAAIKAYKKHNLTLSRLNGELNQELSEIIEERIALEIEFEHLKPFNS